MTLVRRRAPFTRLRLGLLSLAGGGALVLAALSADKLGLVSSTAFGWKQTAVLVAGLAAGTTGLAVVVLERRAELGSLRETSLLAAGLQLAALSSLAIAQPLFDLLGPNPQFFAAHGATPGDIALFIAVVVIVPPAAMLALEAIAGLARRDARVLLHLLFVAALAALIALGPLRKLDRASAAAIFAVAAFAGAAAAVAFAAVPPVRSFSTALAGAPIVFVFLFATSDGISDQLFEEEPEVRPSAAAPSSDAPVVMVVFDEFASGLLLERAGTIDARRFPNFAHLARTSTWYPNATTVSDGTSRAVPALLTGKYPTGNALPAAASQHPQNLFTLLAGHRRMHVREEVTRLCPQRICGEAAGRSREERLRSLASDLGVVYRHLVLPAQLRDDLPDVTTTWGDFAQASRFTHKLEAFSRFLSGVHGDGGPSLEYLHAVLPHMPYEYLPSGKAYDPDPSGRVSPPRTGMYGTDHRGTWIGTQPTVFLAQQRYLLQARFVDRLLGRLMRRLRETGLLDRALLIIVSDHGVSTRKGDVRRTFTRTNIGDLAPVPLFIKRPGQRTGSVDKAYVRTIDVVPTIADLLGVRLPWRTDGRSLATGGYPRPRRLRLVYDTRNTETSTSIGRLQRERTETLARDLEWFGRGSPFPGLAGLSPHRELLGRLVVRVAVRPGGSRAVLDAPDAYERVDVRAGLLPAFATGWLEGVEQGASRDLAVAVNGRIAALTRSFPALERECFAAMLPPAALRQGANDVRVYEIAPGAGEPVLRSARSG